MRRNFGGDPCCVPGCYRRSKKEIPFCERCWSTADDGERAQVQFAINAPFFRPYLSRLEVDLAWFENGVQQPPTWLHNYQTIGEAYAGQVLREYEARTTREAVALAIADRRRLNNDLMADEEVAA